MTEPTEKMRLIRSRFDAGYTMTMIADEIGESVDELCKWIMDYKEPRRRDYVSRTAPAQIVTTMPAGLAKDWEREVERFKAWKRQRDGATATLKSNLG